eukprot:TRINITY_DN47681_c0_g1_i2.p1 TRINITY_DN47681_c0_g1~~TRINITY_DN47681_c0_g1_i2.p1  ORF type:complete len:233 (+),score=17.83 TRINITY_DN47681_c0_g1_i2:371-1069(+)
MKREEHQTDFIPDRVLVGEAGFEMPEDYDKWNESQFFRCPQFPVPSVTEREAALPYRLSATDSNQATSCFSNDDLFEKTEAEVPAPAKWGRASDFFWYPEPKYGNLQKGVGFEVTETPKSELHGKEATCYFYCIQSTLQSYRAQYPYLTADQIKNEILGGGVFHFGKLAESTGTLYVGEKSNIAIFTGSVDHGASGAPVLVEGKLVGIIIGALPHDNRNFVWLIHDPAAELY